MIAPVYSDGFLRLEEHLAGMVGACVDRRAAFDIVLRDMRRAATLAAAGDEVGGVLVLVGANRAASIGIVLDHVEG
jgi:hypothetical protein